MIDNVEQSREGTIVIEATRLVGPEWRCRVFSFLCRPGTYQRDFLSASEAANARITIVPVIVTFFCASAESARMPVCLGRADAKLFVCALAHTYQATAGSKVKGGE